jgi:SGNH hydrolase-like domain, acetyltransferase AlgX
MEEKRKSSVYLLVLLLLMAPLAQTVFRYFNEWPLVGLNEVVKKPTLTATTWFDGSFQDSTNRYVNQTFGFRTWFVRFNNQIGYSLFHKSRANGVTIAPDGSLTDKAHSAAWTGEDCTPENAAVLKDRLIKLQKLNEALSQKGIFLAIVVVSGKGYFFPEKIKGQPPEGKKTLYKQLKSQSDSLGLNLLDLSAWARNQKGKERWPLYNRNGIHWTYAGFMSAADTLVRYIENKTATDLPNIQFKETVWSNIAKTKEETDVFDGMNILTAAPQERLAYPVHEIKGGERKLNLLTIGDSYYFSIFTSGVTAATFASSHFLFYFDTFHDNSKTEVKHRVEVDMLKEIENSDVILLFMMDPNLSKLGSGFVEEATDLYSNTDVRDFAIKKFEEGIRRDAAWMKMIEEKAAAKGISVDAMIRLDAIHLWNTERLR